MTTKNPDKESAVEVPRVKEITDYDPSFHSWNDLVNQADEIVGYRLIKDEDLDTLLGVPFVITRFVFRRGEAIGNGHDGYYVSHECTTAPIDVMQKRVKNLETLAVEPEELIVFNDGSTGIYRQDVKYLQTHGFIKLPEPVIIGGKSGESTFDLGPDKWEGANPNRVEIRFTPDGDQEVSINVRISCPRGIRLSDYNVEGIGQAKTRYLG